MFKTILRLFSYLKYHKKTFITGTALLIAAAGLELCSPLLAKRSIDDVMTPAFKDGNLNLSLLLLLLSGYLLINLLGSLFRYISILHLRKMANAIVKRMRDDLFAHMHQLPISYFDRIPAGKIVARITNDTEVLRSNFYVNVLSNMLSNSISIIGVFIAITLLNHWLGLAVLILLPILFIWQKFYTKYATRYNLDIREYTSQISGQLNEFVQGMPVIQAFQREKQLLTEFKATVGKWHAAGKKYLRLDSAVAWGFANFLRNATILGVIYTLSALFLNGKMALTAGLLYVFIDYINRLFDPIDGMIQIFANIQQSLAAGMRIFDFADEPIEDQSGAELAIGAGAVRFQQVSFGYLADTPVLHDITFTAAAGETVALVGHTGSGKSSILNLLFRFYDPQAGKILIDEQVIKDCNRQSLRRHMAIVLQDPYLFTGTIASNISMGDPTITDEMVMTALDKVGASYLLGRYQQGIHHPVVEKGNEFSSGERQLISFARALVFDPKILILDEATSHVDTETEAIIQKAMEVLQKGRTTFMIAHRLSTIKEANQILVLDKGRIVERGTHQTLLQHAGIYRQMYQMQAEQL
ncbi:ABC transporter ATP-binding protein [Enterococcus diestrammenae]|uniref:ATP-binding cassette, subfamily B, multidrug efflux pump n=1 Tax=Enterococcus diestrammenae TaxID=1155073 RepID=A0ABV0EZE9_9ENTE|nr:ABC transporter ATP-binding protein [Enterococcus diestrammenae]KAF1294948.1 ABC transporter ATP-binding protein [Enterococcus diestrammenae]